MTRTTQLHKASIHIRLWRAYGLKCMTQFYHVSVSCAFEAKLGRPSSGKVCRPACPQLKYVKLRIAAFADWKAKTGRPFNEDGLEIFAILDADQAIVDKDEDKAVLEEGASFCG